MSRRQGSNIRPFKNSMFKKLDYLNCMVMRIYASLTISSKKKSKKNPEGNEIRGKFLRPNKKQPKLKHSCEKLIRVRKDSFI